MFWMSLDHDKHPSSIVCHPTLLTCLQTENAVEYLFQDSGYLKFVIVFACHLIEVLPCSNILNWISDHCGCHLRLHLVYGLCMIDYNLYYFVHCLFSFNRMQHPIWQSEHRMEWLLGCVSNHWKAAQKATKWVESSVPRF